MQLVRIAIRHRGLLLREYFFLVSLPQYNPETFLYSSLLYYSIFPAHEADQVVPSLQPVAYVLLMQAVEALNNQQGHELLNEQLLGNSVTLDGHDVEG